MYLAMSNNKILKHSGSFIVSSLTTNSKKKKKLFLIFFRGVCLQTKKAGSLLFISFNINESIEDKIYWEGYRSKPNFLCKLTFSCFFHEQKWSGDQMRVDGINCELMPGD